MTLTSHQHAGGSDVAVSLIAAELGRVRDLLVSQLTSRGGTEEVERLLKYVGQRGGKMLRPALLLLSGLAAGALTDKHIRAGAIIEMIHTATLLHDDVIDGGQIRRGMPTVNRMWGNEPAVLVGDYLLSHAFCLCTGLDREPARIIAEATTQVCEGELTQITQKHNWDLTEPQYIEIITDKSASLFAAACRVGAHLANGCPSLCDQLAAFGLSMGVAFQITDDLLDLTGDESRAGKTLGADIDNDKPTLALIHLLGHCDQARRAAIQALVEADDRREELSAALSAAGSLDYARDKARRCIDRSLDILGCVRPSPARDALGALAGHIVERTR